MKHWIKGLHAWSLKWAQTRWGSWALFICAFADASFLPLPTPMFFISLVLLHPHRWYKYIFFGTTGSLLGALLGYSIGHFAWLNADGSFSTLANYMFEHVPGFTHEVYGQIYILFETWEFWILFIASLIPVPYKIFSISSGVFDINIVVFAAATLISQAIKFYLLGFFTRKLGPSITLWIQRFSKPITIIVVVAIAVALAVYFFIP